MKSPSVYIESFGCQMNKLDTALVGSALAEAGFRLVDGVKEADVVLINTCSVRQHAEDRVLSHLGHLKHLKEHRPQVVVGVIGCMAQRLGAKLLEHEAVNLVCGPAQIPQIADLIRRALADSAKQAAVTEKIRQPVRPEDSSLDDFELAYGGKATVAVARLRGEGVSGVAGLRPARAEGVPPSNRGPEALATRGRDARDTQGPEALAMRGRDARDTQGQDALATEDKGKGSPTQNTALGNPKMPSPRRLPRSPHDATDTSSVTAADPRSVPGPAFVRVMRGCNYFCTYCVVPYVRGPEACRPPQAVLEQVKRLADAGIQQVTLLGQTVNSYKYQNGEKTYCLADLLDLAAQVPGIEWVRFVTSYPADEFYDQILQVMADSPKVCRYLHLPAQSGSDRILQAMNRHYTAAHYLELLERARALVPDIAVAGDFIVGFPGETDDDFQATVELTRRARYKNCFVFKYSPRPGTTADKRLADTISDEIKQRRNVELLAVQEQISAELNQAFLGRQVIVLVEGPSKKARVNPKDSENHPQLVARTSTDHIVVFYGPVSLAGRFAQVRITRTAPLTLFGELSS
jgi:MiaB/RimO family radical SAM methylthiotransferase